MTHKTIKIELCGTAADMTKFSVDDIKLMIAHAFDSHHFHENGIAYEITEETPLLEEMDKVIHEVWDRAPKSPKYYDRDTMPKPGPLGWEVGDTPESLKNQPTA